MADISVTRQTDISSYFPLLMSEVREFKHISYGENPEFNALWYVLKDVFSDQFVMESTENGVKRWENILKIEPKDTDTLMSRKKEIISRLSETLPYTWRMLIRFINALIGEGNYKIELIPSKYFINMTIELTGENLNYRLLSSVRKMFKRVLPANIEYEAKYVHSAENTAIYLGTANLIATYINIFPLLEKEYHSEGEHLTGARTYTGTVLEVVGKNE